MKRPDPKDEVSVSKIILRDYQDRLIGNIRYQFNEVGVGSVMAVASTGAGKTICFSYIAEHAAKVGNRVFILVHRKELIRQTSKSLRQNNIPHGIIASGYPMTDTPIQICSIQTFISRLHMFAAPELIVFDEAHHCKASNYQKIIKWAKAGGSLILGVTATPCRADGQAFDDDFEVMVETDGITTLMDNGWLVRPTVFAPELEGLDLSGLKEGRNGDFAQAVMDEAMDKPKIVGSVVDHYLKNLPHCPPTVAFCTSVRHAESVAAQFRERGVSAASIDGSMTDEDREKLVAGLDNGSVRVLTSCDLISEGFDLPKIEAIIMLRPIGSRCLSLFMQQLGRVMRIYPGKTKAYVFDHVNNWKVHGFAEYDKDLEPRNWHDGFTGNMFKKKRSKGGNGATRCPKCYSVFPAASICPSCGHNLFEKKKADDADGVGRTIEEVDGQLVELDMQKLLTFKATVSGGRKKEIVIQKLRRIN